MIFWIISRVRGRRRARTSARDREPKISASSKFLDRLVQHIHRVEPSTALERPAPFLIVSTSVTRMSSLSPPGVPLDTPHSFSISASAAGYQCGSGGFGAVRASMASYSECVRYAPCSSGCCLNANPRAPHLRCFPWIKAERGRWWFARVLASERIVTAACRGGEQFTASQTLASSRFR